MLHDTNYLPTLTLLPLGALTAFSPGVQHYSTPEHLFYPGPYPADE